MARWLSIVAGGLGMGLAGPASALVLDVGSWGGCLGLAQCTIGEATLEADGPGAALQQKTGAGGGQGLGISGRTAGEIDPGERLTISFARPVTIDSLRFMFLFNGPEFGDPLETAVVTIADQSFQLQAVGEDIATWTGAGTVANCGATALGGNGCFEIVNPFGSQEIEWLTLTAAKMPVLGNNADFSLGRLVAVPVGEPLSLALLGAGVLGIVAVGKHRRAD
jgi:hypothetical protein